ncbi:hypothetical protein BV25DRAFT_1734637 [Artomyces pyxidatus]|uniref:Uncharacterized protein n=1 Tax=Artomyces pyxidatus TaxID=48021 RepID=A0ACB8SGI1_9AGAM|nr:hypothetical protein BV25DRAFT_1734637 [Artomyces pyxidatus]
MSEESINSDENDRRWLENPGTHLKSEIWWQRQAPAIEQSGYTLRPRFRPGWTPSWQGTKKYWSDVEDGQLSKV